MRMVVASLAWVVIAGASVHAQPAPESVYPPPEPSAADEPRSQRTGFRFDLEARYLTDYVWRGLERFDAGRSEDDANTQYEVKIAFDLGKLPHPYVDVFVNVASDDPVTNFEEVRPEAGFDWEIRPFTLSAGYTSYIFPDRDGIDTGEIFARLTLDDSRLFHTERPVFHPYGFAAFDIDQFEGLYLEAGINHEVFVEGTGLSFLFNGHVAYVNGFELFSRGAIGDGSADDSGFQHWQIGVTARYTLNELLNIPADRFGRISVLGYLNYTDSLDRSLEATNQLWGGVGVSLSF